MVYDKTQNETASNQNWFWLNFTEEREMINTTLFFYTFNTSTFQTYWQRELWDRNLMLVASFENLSVLGENDTLVNMTFLSGRTPVIATVVGGNTTTPNGKYGRAMDFKMSATPQGMVTPNMSGVIGDSDNWTIAFWTKLFTPTAVNTFSHTLFTKPGNSNFILAFNNDSLSYFNQDDSTWYNNLSQHNSVNEWMFITLVRNGTNMTLYHNGVRILVFNQNNNTISRDAIRFGSRTDTYNNKWDLNGSIDEVRVWNRSLSADEIYFQYQTYFFRKDLGTDPFLANINLTNLGKGNYTARLRSIYPAYNEFNTLNISAQLYPFAITARDEELKGNMLTFNVTISDGSIYAFNSLDYASLTTPTLTSDLITYTIRDRDGLYQPRSIVVAGNTWFNFTAYLLKTGSGQLVRFKMLTSSDSVITGVLGQGYVYNGTDWTLVESQLSDITGVISTYLNPLTQYRFVFSKDGYNTIDSTFTASSTDYRVYLSSFNASPFYINASLIPNIVFSFTPNQQVLNNTPVNQTLSFYVNDNSSQLEWYGIDLWYNNTIIGHQNTTGSGLGGGTLSFSVNTSLYSGAMYIILDGYFKKTGYPEYHVRQSYGIGELWSGSYSLWTIASNLRQQSNDNMQFAYGLIALFFTATITGFVAGTVSFVGGGVIALLLLAGFNAMGFLNFGSGILTWTIFIGTGMIVAAVMVLRGRI